MAASHEQNPAGGNEFQEWLRSEEGQQPVKASDAVLALLEDVELDADQRILVWPDGGRRSFEESVAHLQQQQPQTGPDELANLLIDWMEESASPKVSGETVAYPGHALHDWIEALDEKRPSS
jgi:hypothetical protein